MSVCHFFVQCASVRTEYIACALTCSEGLDNNLIMGWYAGRKTNVSTSKARPNLEDKGQDFGMQDLIQPVT